MNRLYPNYKSAVKAIFGQEPLPRRGHFFEDDKLLSFLFKPTHDHPKYQNHTLSKMYYTVTVKPEYFEKQLADFSSNDKINIIKCDEKSSFKNKFHDYGFFTLDEVDYDTCTIRLKLI
jgi:hypothetical protein